MRELILLRHAHAEPAQPGQADAERPLSLRGQAEAEAAARWLAGEGLRPVRVLCSPARRTRETLERVLSVLGYVDVRYEPRIYEAVPGTLMALVEEHAEAGRLLMVGHNPGFEQVAALLHSGQSSDFRGMPTAGIAVLALPAEGPVEPGIGRLTRFWWP
ncbi:SixA phosphatase family protein [Silanimonas lenta]|uniref:SixA phosphatase family protein n=1 Tax=Silanimonas lenta TaxID=265429 RepID=UPI0004194FF5|nr:histidine phosphatase family protein [Silanimonas lenta]